MIKLPRYEETKKYLMSGKALNQLADAIEERTPIPGDGLGKTDTPHGRILRAEGATGGGGGENCQFQAEVVEGVFRFTNAGSISGGGMPSNMVVTGELWSVAVPETGTRYIKLTVATDGNAVTSCELAASTTPANPIGITEGVAPSAFEIDLYVVINRVPYRVIGCRGLAATTSEALVTSALEPVCSGDPYVRHYTWIVTSN